MDCFSVEVIISIAVLMLTALGMGIGWFKEVAYKKAAKDHGLAIQYLKAIVPEFIDGVRLAFLTVIPDQALQGRIDTYLGKRKYKPQRFEPFQLSKDQINNPQCCKTIEDVIAAVEAFKKESPSEAKKLGLL